MSLLLIVRKQRVLKAWLSCHTPNVPKYYFHIRHGGELIPDEVGVYLSGMEAARVEARDSAIDLVAGDMRAGHGVIADVIEITNAGGRMLEVLNIRDVMN
jgi:hypothetical protein